MGGFRNKLGAFGETDNHPIPMDRLRIISRTLDVARL